MNYADLARAEQCPGRIFHIPRPSRIAQALRARLSPPRIPPEMVQEVLACYGLSLSRQPQNLSDGWRHASLIIATPAGKKVLKMFRPNWKPATIAHEHSILLHLAALDFPSPRLVITPGGQTVVHHLGRNYVLFDFIAGENYAASYLPRSQRLALLARGAAALAHYHRIIDGFAPQGEHHLGASADQEGAELSWHLDHLKTLPDRPPAVTQPGDAALVRWLVERRSAMTETLFQSNELLEAAGLPRLVIHGDFGLHNLIFSPGGEVTLLDFELARLEWRLSDLAAGLARHRPAKGPADFTMMRCLLQSYQRQNRLSRDERRLLPQVWAYRSMARAVRYWDSALESKHPHRRLADACRAAGDAFWALAEADRLRALSEPE